MTDPILSPRLLEIASVLLPGTALDSARLAVGQFHEVVLVPGVAAVRVSRDAGSAAALPRRTELLRQVAKAGLPFAVPEPLTAVTHFGDRAAVAVSWIGGSRHPEGQGDPAVLRGLLAAIRDVPLSSELRAVLGQPHEYAGGPRWARLMAGEVVPRLPPPVRAEAERRIEQAQALDPVTPALVHGDLSGENVHWSPDGRLLGVLDWDLAQPFDPAIDAACLAWHGWENVRAAVDAETYRRAGIWYLTFGIEQIAAAVLAEEPPEQLDRRVEETVSWLKQTADWQMP